MRLTGAITAGGRSRRFGQDKALYRMGGHTLLERAAFSLGACWPRLLIAPEGRYALADWEAVGDLRPGLGPLAGLETALSAAPAGWLAYCAVDLPCLTPAYWGRLLARTQPDARTVVGLDAQGRRQPLAALYHSSALATVSALLDAGERRMLALLDELESVSVPWSELQDLGGQLYHNLNTPQDADALGSALSLAPNGREAG
ncbi:molybdenum cofactor guanylyltransferase [Deinococcus sp.]|uniref:molybdenum cofactor guanylyltransferase n=1 Tax=Deinococcus sp. TaxID=47478 RepID=UPI003CC54B8D